MLKAWAYSTNETIQGPCRVETAVRENKTKIENITKDQEERGKTEKEEWGSEEWNIPD